MIPEASALRAQDASMDAIVRSFVVPDTFDQLTTVDHAFLIGPRGSGKTTLLRMLSCRYVAHWLASENRTATRHAGKLGFTGVFLPTDSLWTTQTHRSARTMAFACQLMNRLVDAMRFRVEKPVFPDGSGRASAPVELTPRQEADLVLELANVWAVRVPSPTLRALGLAVDRLLLTASSSDARHPLAQNPFRLAIHAVRYFNSLIGESEGKWAILIDEIELAPDEIVAEIMRLVRAGSSELILKVSMSPSDHMRASKLVSDVGRPMPGNDYLPVHLLTQSLSAKRNFTQVLWHQAQVRAGIDPLSVEESFGRSFQASARDEGEIDPVVEEFKLAQSWDRDFADWMRTRGLTVDQLAHLDYAQRSAVVRKVYPLLVYRNGVYKLSRKPEGWGRRSRKKEYEAFSGSLQIINALEGNPRWIKTAFRLMLEGNRRTGGRIDLPLQFSALLDVSRSFESFLRFLPIPAVEGRVQNDLSLVTLMDAIASAMHGFHTGRFTADPPNSFVVDAWTEERFSPLLDLGLYSGAIVHLRSTASSVPIMSSYAGQRFRLTYLLAVRPGLSFPMRLGRPVQLSGILASQGILSAPDQHPDQLRLPWGSND